MEKLSILSAVLIFVCVSLIFTFGLFHTFSNWGQNDWDQFLFWNAVPRITILEYHQFPLWNPYGNGGNVLLAHPHSSFLSPFYLLVLIFGPLFGLKLEIILHLFLGMLGMYCLCHHWKLSKIASYSASFIFMLSSIYPLHLTEGHADWLPLAYFPWLFLFYEKGLENKKYILAGILSSSLMILGGSVDIFPLSILFLSAYTVFKTIQQKSSLPIKVFLFIFIGTGFLCAIKLSPMLELLYHYPRFKYDTDGVGWSILAKILLNRNQAGLVNQQIVGANHFWHEYGAYVGLLPILLFTIGVFKELKKRWPLFLTGIICLLIAMGIKSPLNLWRILRLFPPYCSLTCPSRYILGVVFCLALFSAIAINYLGHLVQIIKSKGRQRAISVFFAAIPVFILLDLFVVNSAIWEKAFVHPPVYLEKQEVFQQRYDTLKLPGFASLMYPVTLSNSGIIDSYEVIAVERGEVEIASQPDEYRGEVYLADNKGNISLVSFSPNKVAVDVNVTQPDRAVLNQNYFSGWQATDNERVRRVTPYKGLISLPVNKGYHRIIFYYLPSSFLLGLCVSAIFILIVLISNRTAIKEFLKRQENDKVSL